MKQKDCTEEKIEKERIRKLLMATRIGQKLEKLVLKKSPESWHQFDKNNVPSLIYTLYGFDYRPVESYIGYSTKLNKDCEIYLVPNNSCSPLGRRADIVLYYQSQRWCRTYHTMDKEIYDKFKTKLEYYQMACAQKTISEISQIQNA